MGHLLGFNPEGPSGKDVVTIADTVTFSAGTTDWTIEFSVAFDSYPTTGNWYIFGSSTTTKNSGFCLRQASGAGVLALVSTGSHVPAADSPAGFILADGEQHTYRVERVAGNSISFYRDGVPVLESKSWVTASNFPLSLSRFGRGSVSGGVTTPMRLAWFDATATAPPNGQRWDANLSGGTGSTLPTVSGVNQGTLVNFTVPDCWIYYDAGGGPTATQIKLFDGAAFVSKPIKRWDGSAFVDVTLKRWDGSAFIDL